MRSDHDQEVPRVAARGDDCVIAIPDSHAEFVAPQVVPDVLDRVELRRVGWQWQKRDVDWHVLSPARSMPSGAVAHQDGMRAGRYLRADLLEVLVHRLAVGRRHDDRRTYRTGRTDRAEQIDEVVAAVAHRKRTRANRGQTYSSVPFWAHPGFVLIGPEWLHLLPAGCVTAWTTVRPPRPSSATARPPPPSA